MMFDELRKPIEKPLRCFGSEYRSDDTMCQKCEHRLRCITASDFRADRVTLDRISFNLVKEEWQLDVKDFEDKPAAVQAVFATCHEAVFSKPAKFRIPIDKAVVVLRMAQKTDCSLPLFISTIMLAHGQNRQSAFFPGLLWGPSAEKCISRYRNACTKAYGHFDVRAVEKMVGQMDKSSDVEDQLLNSEIIFGNTVVSLKIRGRPVIFEQVFLLKEIELAPIWLSIEPSYGQVLKSEETKLPLTEGLRKHRQNVARILKHAERQKTTLAILNKIREKILPRAISTVLSYHGLQPTDFEMINRPITAARSFWQKLGDVLQDYYCLQAITGDQHAMRKISL